MVPSSFSCSLWHVVRNHCQKTERCFTSNCYGVCLSSRCSFTSGSKVFGTVSHPPWYKSLSQHKLIWLLQICSQILKAVQHNLDPDGSGAYIQLRNCLSFCRTLGLAGIDTVLCFQTRSTEVQQYALLYIWPLQFRDLVLNWFRVN